MRKVKQKHYVIGALVALASLVVSQTLPVECLWGMCNGL